jgi:feruloyl esterase
MKINIASSRPLTGRLAVVPLCGCVALAGCNRAPADDTAAVRSTPASCETLAAIALPDTKVTKVERVEAGAFVAPPLPPWAPVSVDYSTLPAFCRVAATAAPTPDSAIKFEVWLPVEGWNGKFVAVGNGGFSGFIFHFAMAEPLRRGYAVAGTDTGHEGGRADASFAVGHPEKLVDFAWRAVHETTMKSKAMVTALYSEPPRRSYVSAARPGEGRGSRRRSASLMTSTASPLAPPRTTGFR